ncbi:MAG: rhodanese-like domain-containing protein [Acidobacteria bacterium]|nr:rhodanese-like domain-containing protein [Acidobacteriota bacterium]
MGVKDIDVRQARELQENEGYTYVDVRSVPEFDGGHPAGACNVPLLHRDPATGQMMPNPEFLAVMQANYAPDARLLIGCQMGGRSARAAGILASAGYTEVCNVMGGFGGAYDRATGQVIHAGWSGAGLPVETAAAPAASYEELRTKAGS